MQKLRLNAARSVDRSIEIRFSHKAKTAKKVLRNINHERIQF